MDLDTVVIYWDINKVFETNDSFLGEYLIVDPQTNTVVEFGVTQIGGHNKKHYQQCIREALDQLFDSHSVNTILISSVRKTVKPELEIGRLKHANREQAQSTKICVSEVHDKSNLLGVLGNHYNDLDQGFTGFATQVPPSETLRVYVDGSYRFEEDRASVGVCILTSADRLVYLQSTEISAQSPEHAEVRAIIEAVQRATKFTSSVIVYSDCSHIKYRLDDPSSAKDHLQMDLRRLSNLLDRSIAGGIRFVPREENRFADRLVNQGYRENTVLSCRYLNTRGTVASFSSEPVIKSRSQTQTSNSKHKYQV